MQSVKRGSPVQSRLTTTLFTTAIAAWMAPLVFAQSDTGSLSGVITDPNGAVIPAAKLKIKHDQNGRELDTVTSDAGLYIFPNLTAGPYSLTVEQAGFKRLNRSGIVIALASRLVLDL